MISLTVHHRTVCSPRRLPDCRALFVEAVSDFETPYERGRGNLPRGKLVRLTDAALLTPRIG